MGNIKDYFNIKELVCKHVYTKFGESAWQFFDPRLLETLVTIREAIAKPIYVNNWEIGGQLSQRGLRCNICSLVKSKTTSNVVYLSAHSQGLAVDFDVKGKTADEVRSWLTANSDILPYPIRLEADVSWVHLDMRNNDKKNKIIMFKG